MNTDGVCLLFLIYRIYLATLLVVVYIFHFLLPPLLLNIHTNKRNAASESDDDCAI